LRLCGVSHITGWPVFPGPENHGVSIMSEYEKIAPPSWRTAVTIYVEVLEHGDSQEGKRAAREELLRLADIVDAMRADRAA